MAVTRQMQFYLDRAAEARADAASATLENVRERCLRAEEAWNRMANQAARTQDLRDSNNE